jgi:hypothetical protein
MLHLFVFPNTCTITKHNRNGIYALYYVQILNTAVIQKTDSGQFELHVTLSLYINYQILIATIKVIF